MARRIAKKRRDAQARGRSKAGNIFDVKESVPAPDLGSYILWIYGEPGIGKSSVASRFSRTFHFMFGDRDCSLRIRKKQITDWEEFEKATEVWADRTDYDTAVIDVVDEAYELCFEYMCSGGRLKDPWGNDVDHPNDANDMGKSWKKIKRRFIAPIQRLIAANKGLILISHGKMSERKTAEGEEVEDVHPAISGQGLEVLWGISDVIGYYHIRAGNRVLQIQPSAGIVAKCRPEENFRYSNGSIISRIPMGTNPDESFTSITEAFANRLEPPEAKKFNRRRRVQGRQKSSRRSK